MKYSEYLTEVLNQLSRGTYFLCHASYYANVELTKKKAADPIVIGHFHGRFKKHIKRLLKTQNNGSDTLRVYFLRLSGISNINTMSVNKELEYVHKIKIDWLEKQIKAQQRKEATHRKTVKSTYQSKYLNWNLKL